ncbi:MAG: hypothetical protein K5930_07650 [Treponemataceae bacterium]|nr:hypothetical protein [Treponemataceae bacterium]
MPSNSTPLANNGEAYSTDNLKKIAKEEVLYEEGNINNIDAAYGSWMESRNSDSRQIIQTGTHVVNQTYAPYQNTREPASQGKINWNYVIGEVWKRMIKNRSSFIIFVFSLISTLAIAQEKYVNMFLEIDFFPSLISFTELNPDNGELSTSTYSGIYREGNPLSTFCCENGENLFVLKSSGILIIYKDDKKYPVWGVNQKKYRSAETFVFDDEILSDSFLVEPNFTYSASNLGNMFLDSPWCEGEKDDGKGVKIDMGLCGTGFIISNGFVSKKQYLYEYNNRIKTIKLTDSNDSDFMKIIELQDKAEPQYVFIDNIPGRHINIEILETYSGSKWNDTCINFIIKLFNR